MRLYCATTNPGKLREFIDIVGDVVPVPDLARIAPPPETGSTFEENASQKAAYYSRFCDGLLFADDSGIEVDALGGAPGIYSARFAGEGATDERNNTLLLARMRSVTNRAARFVCAVAVADRGRVLKTFRGSVEGQLLEEPRGNNGFGYDPLFYYPPFGCSFGEISAERKKQVSHRGHALRAMRAWLETR